ncbi:Kinase [Hexamita inflata]|uniref:CMGC DYRK n=1 Tax=Hexamita inflata TaxID=28002 RepID=A0AA86RIN3_9EUKA|nr:CMGC DYRK [Hexamita inflata]
MKKLVRSEINLFNKHGKDFEPVLLDNISLDDIQESVEVIHGYLVREEIGQTPTGIEKLVENLSGQKFILKAFDVGLEEIGRIEIRMIQMLKGMKACPNLTDFFYYNKKLHMIINYMPYSLKTMIYEDNLSIQNIKKIMIRITHILKHLHDQSIIHGDIQPLSFRLTPNNIPSTIITNFQCSRIISTDYIPQKQQPINYRAPDIIQGKQTSKQADLWSLGCLFYELIMKKPLFDVESLDIVVIQQLHLFKYQHLKETVINKIIEELYYKFSPNFLTKLGLSTKAAKYPVNHVLQTYKQLVMSTINDEIMCIDKWKQEDKENCIKLLYGLLNHDPNKRFDCMTILKSPFLQE